MTRHLRTAALAAALILAPLAASADARGGGFVTAIQAKVGGPGGKDYLSSYYWADRSCDDARVGLWTQVGASKNAQWLITPVDPDLVEDKIPGTGTKVTFYYVESNEKVRAGCAQAYLSGVFDCGDEWVGLHTNGDEKGLQWWEIEQGSDGGYLLVNVWHKRNCAANIYLTTNGEWAYRQPNKTGDNINTVFSLVDKPGDVPLVVSAPKGAWRVACSGGANCSSELQKSVSLGSIDKNAWTSEVKHKLSIAIENTGEMEILPGAKGSTKVSYAAETEWSSGSVRELVRSSDESTSESCGTNIDMSGEAIGVVWQWQISANAGPDTVTMKFCQYRCTADGTEPTGGPLAKANLNTCDKKG